MQSFDVDQLKARAIDLIAVKKIIRYGRCWPPALWRFFFDVSSYLFHYKDVVAPLSTSCFQYMRNGQRDPCDSSVTLLRDSHFAPKTPLRDYIEFELSIYHTLLIIRKRNFEFESTHGKKLLIMLSCSEVLTLFGFHTERFIYAVSDECF